MTPFGRWSYFFTVKFTMLLASGPDAQKILRERMDEYCERRADAGFKDEPCVAKWIKARDEAEKAEQAKLEAEQRAEVAAFEKTKRLYWENFESEQKERNPIFSLDWAEANGLIKEQVDQFKRERARRWT